MTDAPSQPGALVLAAVDLPPERTPTLVYLASLARSGRRSQLSALEQIAQHFLQAGSPHDVPWWLLRYEHLQALRRWLIDRYAPSTAQRMLAAVRCVIRESCRLGLMAESDYRQTQLLAPIRGSRDLAGRRLLPDEIAKLFVACDAATPMGARNAAVLGLLFGAGLRREELVHLRLDAYTSGSLRVIGKGNKERIIPLPPGARAAVARWLGVRGIAPGPLVCPLLGPNVVLRQMSVENVTDLLRRLKRRAGLERFSPHDMRRSYGTSLLEAGVDLGTVQDLMGHASPVTTRKYDRRGERERDAAVVRLCVPFVDVAEPVGEPLVDGSPPET